VFLFHSLSTARPLSGLKLGDHAHAGEKGGYNWFEPDCYITKYLACFYFSVSTFVSFRRENT